MNEKIIENYINSMDELHFSDTEKDRISMHLKTAADGKKESGRYDIRSYRHRERKRQNMKRFNLKTAVLVAAIAVMAVGGTAFAAGKIAYTGSSSSLLTAYHRFGDLEKAEKEAGIDVNIVESFNNGFDFDSMRVVDSYGGDEDGNKLITWKELSVTYTKGKSKVFLDAQSQETLDSVAAMSKNDHVSIPTRTIEIGGTEVSYDLDEYLFLPGSYEENEEKRAELASEFSRQETDDHFFISYGTESVERKYFKNVSYNKDGVHYMLFTYDEVSEDELIGMAEELINA